MIMNKYLLLILTALTFSFVSCDDYEPGATATEALAGDWYVTYSVKVGNEWQELVGPVLLTTYNTAANVSTEMFVDDHGSFWEIKGKVKANPSGRSFGSDNEVDNYYYDSKFKVKDGLVLPKQAHSPSNVVTDSIVFYVSFNDDGYENDNGEMVLTPYETTYRVSGFRRTGFLEDEF